MPGKIALIGSGELSDAMAEVHRQLMSRLGEPARPVFVDSMAGFELNISAIDQKALAYFRRNFNLDLALATYHAPKDPPEKIASAVARIQQANYIFAGPGSPSYGLRVLSNSPVWDAVVKRWREGAMLVFASAAALTLGAQTIPVYEIYKVGEDPFWLPGLNLLGEIGLNAAVVPHWNNRSGDQHDTRFCFMGAPRFAELDAALPPDTVVLGIDEYTALVLEPHRAEVLGVGQVTIRQGGQQSEYKKGQAIDLDHPDLRLRVRVEALDPKPEPGEPTSEPDADIVRLGDSTAAALTDSDLAAVSEGLLALSLVAGAGLEQGVYNRAAAAIQQLQTLLPRLNDLAGSAGEEDTQSKRDGLLNLVVQARESLRAAKLWAEADVLRDGLAALNYAVTDTREGPQIQIVPK